jgi:hypothetical protein
MSFFRHRSKGLHAALSAAGLICFVACGGADTTATTPGKLCSPIGQGGDVLPPAPDGASLCPAGPCNYQSQTGCTGSDSCAIHIDDTAGTAAPTCEAAGTVARDAACSDSAPCGNGLVCVDKVCRKLCCGSDWTACGAGEGCVQQIHVSIGTGKPLVDPQVGICVPVNDCNVLDAHSCTTDPTRPVCRIADPIGDVACQPASSLNLGDTCDSDHQCGPVMLCAGADSSGQSVCRSLCRADRCGTPSCSNVTDTCVHFNRDPAGVGECTPDWTGGLADAGAGFASTDAGSR